MSRRFFTRYGAERPIGGRVVGLVLAAAGAALFIALAPDGALSTACTICIFSVAAAGLNLLVGSCGQVSLGQGAFMALGAYASAVLVVDARIPGLVTVPLAAAVTVLAGVLFGVPSLRFRGFSLAITSLAAQVVVEWALLRVPRVRGGESAIPLPKPALFGLHLEGFRALCAFDVVALALALGAAWFIARGRFGRLLVAVRDQETAAPALGVNVVAVKLAAFALSAAFGGAAGAMFAQTYGIADFEQFRLVVSIQLLATATIGGLGSSSGPLLGSCVIVLLPIAAARAIRTWGGVVESVPAWSGLAFGLLLLAFLRLEPRGLAHLCARAFAALRRWPFV